MEAIFATRGKYEEVETLITWLRCQIMPLLMKKGDGTTIAPLMECMVRPIQLWGFVFPKEYKDLIVNSLNLHSKGSDNFSADKDYGINTKLWAIRKLLHAKEFEAPKPKIIDGKEVPFTDKLPIPYERWKNTNIFPIGYIEDGEIAELRHERI